MLWIKAFHVVFVVTWFSGLFYLPRLFVYHAQCNDSISNDRFKIMERKLFFGITTPSAILATLLGICLFIMELPVYGQAPWLHAKLFLVFLLWIYHIYCGKFWYAFKRDDNKHSHIFYRWFNEVPVLLLIAIVILVIVKPNL
jgi:putative membrane protein